MWLARNITASLFMTHESEPESGTSPHIGREIRRVLLEQRRSPSWLARQLYCDRTNVYKIFGKSSIDTLLLGRISRVLEYDFFHILSDHYMAK